MTTTAEEEENIIILPDNEIAVIPKEKNNVLSNELMGGNGYVAQMMNVYFDLKDPEIITIKNDHNTVFKVANQYIVKMREFTEIQAQDKPEKELMEFVNFVGQRISLGTYADPGVITEEFFILLVTRLVPGQQMELMDFKSRECVMAIGKHLAEFHQASRDFQSFYPEIVEGFKNDFGKKQQYDIPITTESYGLIHSDFHSGNYNVEKEESGECKVHSFDYESVRFGFYVFDLGHVVSEGIRRLGEQEQSSDITKESILQDQQQMVDWLLEGYNGKPDGVNREHLFQIITREPDQSDLNYAVLRLVKPVQEEKSAFEEQTKDKPLQEKYYDELFQIMAYGFEDEEQILKCLDESNGSVPIAIERMLNVGKKGGHEE